VKSDVRDESPSTTPKPYDRRILDYCAGLLTRIERRRAKQLARRVRRDLGLDVSAFELARWLREDPRFVREAVAPNNAYWRLQLRRRLQRGSQGSVGLEDVPR
jgi:hypothetical protein